MGRKTWGLAAAAAAAAIAVPAAYAAGTPQYLDPAYLASIDDAQVHGTITPPGADTQHATTEIAPYDNLVQAYPSLTPGRLGDFFKLRLFVDKLDVGRTETPKAGVTVVRDARWGEPHIFGVTDDDMAFGAGYVSAEDRYAIMELLRALGRSEAFQLLGTTPAWLADLEMARLYGYTEDELQAQVDRLPKVYGKPGADIVRMLGHYVDGINDYLAEAEKGSVPMPAGLADLGITSPAPWKVTDVVAAVSTVRALFGAGGGSEMNDASVLAGLIRDYGAQQGRSIYEDFRSRDNLDGPVHTVKPFPYDVRTPDRYDPKASAIGFDPGTPGILGQLQAGQAAKQLAGLAARARIRYDRLVLNTPIGSINLSRPGDLSNHLVIGKSRSATGHPILLGGPQAGYFSPEILMDSELHSPSIHARGASFPGLSLLVIMGRTQDYAWSPTAGGSDMIDTYVEKLCNPNGTPVVSEDSRYYEFDGKCVEMDRRTYRTADQAPAAIRDGLPDIIVERTVHGPVLARGKIGTTPVAVTQKRSSYGKELDPAVSILKMNRDEAKTGADFVSIFRESHNLSTNWSYINDNEIAYVHGGLYPRRPANADPDLPVWGTGQYEWAKAADGQDDYLGREEVPYEVAPKRDYFVSWNNRPAPRWNGSDAQWGWSSIYRAKMLEDAILAQPKGTITPTKLVQMMERVGLTDIRGRYVLPLALKILRSAPAPAPREQKMIALLERWIAHGTLRRDGDKDGNYDDGAAVAIMDAWWEKLIRAVFDPEIGDSSRIPLPFDNAPGSGGSAYQDGWYGYLWTDFRMALGEKVRSPTSELYCGGGKGVAGNLPECAKRVLASLVAAGDALQQSSGSDDPSTWNADARGERILFLPGAALSMEWVNRPTTQQLAMFGRLGRHPAKVSGPQAAPCARRRTFASIGATPRGRGLAIRVRPRGGASVAVELLRVSAGSQVLAGLPVHDFGTRRRSFTWNGAGASDAYYVLRFRGRDADGRLTSRHIALRRIAGRFHTMHTFERRRACGALASFALDGSLFGGRLAKPLDVTFTLFEKATIGVEVRRGARVVRRARSRSFAAGVHHLRFSALGLRAGDYSVRLKVRGAPSLVVRARRLARR